MLTVSALVLVVILDEWAAGMFVGIAAALLIAGILDSWIDPRR